MKTLKSHNIKIDHDAFVVYHHKPSNSLIALDRKDMKRMHQLIKDNKILENAPEDEIIEAIPLHFNLKKNTWENISAPSHLYKVKDLTLTITML